MENDFQRLFEKMDKIIDEASNQQKNIESKFNSFSETQKEIEAKLEVINKEFEKQITDFKTLSISLIKKLNLNSDSFSESAENKINEFVKNSESAILEFKSKSESILKTVEGKSLKIFDKFESLIEKKANVSDIQNLNQIISDIDNRIKKLEQFAHKHLILGGKL